MPNPLVAWIGKPDHWTPPEVSVEDAQWVLAATDDALPEVIQLGHKLDKLHVHLFGALKAIDRYLLRGAVDGRYNPDWQGFKYKPQVVVKAPASSLSSGVRLLDLGAPEIDIVRRLRDLASYAFEDLYGVIEEFIEGDAIEVSGVKLAGQIFFFHQLRQHWTADWSRIELYERVFDYWWLYDETLNALDQIGLDDCAFCVEWRVTGFMQAKLIEINPRLGDEDKCYFETLWHRAITDQIEDWAQEVWAAELQEIAPAVAQVAHGK